MFFKKIFRFFAWIFFDKLLVKIDRFGVRMPGGDFLFKGITFVFWDFLVQFQGIFPKQFFLFLSGFGLRILGGMFRSQKKASECSDYKFFKNFLSKLFSDNYKPLNFFFIARSNREEYQKKRRIFSQRLYCCFWENNIGLRKSNFQKFENIFFLISFWEEKNLVFTKITVNYCCFCKNKIVFWKQTNEKKVFFQIQKICFLFLLEIDASQKQHIIRWKKSSLLFLRF